MVYDENAFAQKQILARKARIGDIDRILIAPPQMGQYGKPLVLSGQSRVRLTTERVRLLYENEMEERRLKLVAESVVRRNSYPAGEPLLGRAPAGNMRDRPEENHRAEANRQDPHRPRPGRPRHDEERARVRTLKDSGFSWEQIAIKINGETGQHKSAQAYRALLQRN
jgi:hypothetical protein